MSAARRKWAIVIGAGAVLVAAGVWRAVVWAQPRAYELKSAVVTRLDVSARSGEIQFVHPKSGRTTYVGADRIPEDCEIRINGESATLADVQVGDTVAVRGLVYPLSRTVQPQQILVTRGSNGPDASGNPLTLQRAP